jgi:hypothetical protein
MMEARRNYPSACAYVTGCYSRFSMDPTRAQAILLAAAFLAALSTPAGSQSIKEFSVNPAAPEARTVPAPAPFKPQFSDSLDPHRPHSLQFRALDQMTERDRSQAANAESAIAKLARDSNLEFNQRPWAYQQILCPALPNHIFLRYLGNNGAGDATVFTASISRGQQGRVRIIPIERRGYSLFSPVPINTLTISVFNHIRAAENLGPDSETAPAWFGTALCYAALAGGHLQAEPSPSTRKLKSFLSPTGPCSISAATVAPFFLSPMCPLRQVPCAGP